MLRNLFLVVPVLLSCKGVPKMQHATAAPLLTER